MTGLIGKKPCKKQKKNILEKKLLSIMHKEKKLWNKSQESFIKFVTKKKEKIKEYQRKIHQELVQYKKEALKINIFLFFP